MPLVQPLRVPRRSTLTEALQTLALGGMLIGLMAIPGLVVAETWIGQAMTKKAWTIGGPPCPVVERPAMNVVGHKRPKDFDYGGMNLARHFGHASCVGWREGGLVRREQHVSVCQFNAPGALTVTTPTRRIVYQPGVARPATIILRDGAPSCVMGGWFDPAQGRN